MQHTVKHDIISAHCTDFLQEYFAKHKHINAQHVYKWILAKYEDSLRVWCNLIEKDVCDFVCAIFFFLICVIFIVC